MASPKNSQPARIGVLLINLGGPDTLDDVKPFLYNLFSDPEIIQLPIPALQKPVAWLISTTRHKKSANYYRQIGGGSPQRKITEQQAQALETELTQRGIQAKTYVGMACWHPLVEDTFEQIKKDQITHLIILPLFPQFSVTTTGSAAKKLIRIINSQGGVRHIRRSYITRYETHPAYIEALAQMTVAEFRKLPDQNPTATTLLFSAHSIPEKYVRRGDPYLKQTQATVAAVMARVRYHLGAEPLHFLSFQSKIGPVKWLEPSTEATLRQFAEERRKQVLAIPISFVSEHIETLYEMDILYKEMAENAQLPFFRVPTLNCHPLFIQSLADLVETRLRPQPQLVVKQAGQR